MPHRNPSQPRREVSGLTGDSLYGDRENLRRYRDNMRDEHRRFAALYERDHGEAGRMDALTGYDEVDAEREIAERMAQYRAERGFDTAEYDDRSRYHRHPRPQQHRGVGPRGYQRSDARIYEDVCERLTEDDRVDASHIEVRVENGDVTLTGSVRSRTAKRRAMQVAEEVSGIRDVFNNIHIVDEQRVAGQ